MGKRILHVEDKEDWRQRVAEHLTAAGHEVVSFATLADAKQAYQEGKYDLVICDGSVDQTGDGSRWAMELYALGQKVIILAAYSEPPANLKIGYHEKSWFDSEKFVRLVNET